MTLPEQVCSGKVFISRMFVMDEGLIVADGLTMEILENAKLLDAHGLERA